jgi:translation elongation factor P/translation initiation factor 5A
LIIAKRNDAKLTIVNIIDSRTYSSYEVYDAQFTEKSRSFSEELPEVPHIIKSTPNSLANFLGIIALGEPNSKRVSTTIVNIIDSRTYSSYEVYDAQFTEKSRSFSEELLIESPLSFV